MLRSDLEPFLRTGEICEYLSICENKGQNCDEEMDSCSKRNLEAACLTQKDVHSEKCKETGTVCTGEKKRVHSE